MLLQPFLRKESRLSDRVNVWLTVCLTEHLLNEIMTMYENLPKKCLTGIFMLLLFVCQQLYAQQQRTVTGIVRDE